MLQQVMTSFFAVFAIRDQYPFAPYSRMYRTLYLACLALCVTALHGCPLLEDSKTTYCPHVHTYFASTAHPVTSQLGSGAGSVPHPTPPIFGSAVGEVHSPTHSDIRASGSGRRLDVHVAKDPSVFQRIFLAPNSHIPQFSWFIICLMMWPSIVAVIALIACVVPSIVMQTSTPPAPSFDS